MATRAGAGGQGAYTYSAQPRAVAGQKKFREPGQAQKAGNIMHDRRIVRGSTYAPEVLPSSAIQEQEMQIQRQAEAARRKQQAKRQRQMREKRPATPEPVDGRKHIEIQTEVYLEEITDRVEEVDIETQTDPFMDRPPTPVYVPVKSGIDAETQVEDGELFDFDFEAEPLLEVLIGKTLEQSLLEVLEEQELANMQAHQFEFEQRRNAELAETQRMEMAERRRLEEKERRLDQERVRLAKEKEARERLAAQNFAERYLTGLQDTVFQRLTESGFFYDSVLKEVESQFMPWVLNQTSVHLEKAATARKLVDVMVADALTRAVARRREIAMVKRMAAVRDEVHANIVAEPLDEGAADDAGSEEELGSEDDYE